MKKIFHLFLLATLGTGLLGCGNDDERAYPPTFQGFRYEPAEVYPGDSVTITAVQLHPGHDIYGARHNWTLTLQVDNGGTAETLVLSYTTPTGKFESSTDNPVWKIAIPANAIGGAVYPCRFEANWSNASDGELGFLSGGTGEGCTGLINSENGTLYSRASGSFNLPIRRRQ